jgi:putative tryptophan/tyrosine transport system substrate-binding protein
MIALEAAMGGVTLSRRHFLCGGLTLIAVGLLSGCRASPSPPPPPTKVPRIGWLGIGPGVPAQDEAFRQGLRDLGYAEGQNIVIERRRAERSPDELPDAAAELARLSVDLIVAAGGATIPAAMQATTTIPIVMVLASDPVQSGYVAGLARPGGNVTGLSQITGQLSAKRLELLKEAVPGLAEVGFLWNPDISGRGSELSETESAARALGLRVRAMAARTLQELEAAFAAAAADPPDAIYLQNNFLINPNQGRIAEWAARSRLPTIYGIREFAEAGGLMAYGPNQPDMFRRAATYADKILKGMSPAELPVEQPTKFDFVINLKTAQALGLTIPQSVLQQATELIQ